ncbi:MAG: PAS domain S-box protein [Flavobacteriales bacterium]
MLTKHAQLEAIKDSSPVGIFVTDQLGSCTYTNPAYQKCTGLSAEESLGIGWIKALHEDDKSLVLQAWNSFVHENAPFDIEYRFKINSEEIRWVSVKANPIYNNGELSGYVGMVNDITNKREISRRLLESQQIAKLGSWEFTPHTGALIWSKEHYDIFEIDESVKENLYEAYRNKIHPEDIPELDKVVHDAVQKGMDFSYEHRAIMTDGRIKHVLGQGRVIKNAKGESIKISGTVQDFTERHHLSQEIYLLKELIDKSQDQVTIINADGFYVYANKTALKAFQLANKKLSSINAKDLIPELKGNEKLFTERIQLLREKKQIVSERKLQTTEGKAMEVEIAASYLKLKNKEYIITFSRDISERNKLIQEKEEAEFKSKLKEEFLAHMSHEIRTPLNAIIGLGNLLNKNKDTQKQKEYIETININAKNLAGIVNDILDFSKIESGKMHVENSMFNIAQTLHETTASIAPAIKKKKN